MNNEEIAEVCHEVNAAYCRSLGDMSQNNWADAPGWQKDSAVAGVDFHRNGDRTPADSHNSWIEQKLREGWVYGEVKDEDRKLHPCMVPFELLPQEQRAKDYIFKAIVDALVG